MQIKNLVFTIFSDIKVVTIADIDGKKYLYKRDEKVSDQKRPTAISDRILDGTTYNSTSNSEKW